MTSLNELRGFRSNPLCDRASRSHCWNLHG